MKQSELKELYSKKLSKIEYKRCFYADFDYTNTLKYIMYRKKFQHNNATYNDVIIMLDTETSKDKENKTRINHKGRLCYIATTNYVILWTLSIRAYNRNVVTLYGRTPYECIECIEMLLDAMREGAQTYIYIHNMSYDWWFLRKFFIDRFDKPIYQLNTKPHYPIVIEFANGLFLRDSLILAQRGIEKWANDLNVEHKKAVGTWDYNKLRNQDTPLSNKELTYAEFDTLAGVECIDATVDILGCNISNIPLTSTGIIRADIRRIGRANNQRDLFLRLVPDVHIQTILEKVFHGGYTQARYEYVGWLMENVKAYDFASSYPFVMLTCKFAMEKFTPCPDADIDWIMKNRTKKAFVFKIQLYDIDFNYDYCMPMIQEYKCEVIVDGVTDSGRVISAKYLELYTNEVDFYLYYLGYNLNEKNCKIVECYSAYKDYLPKWLTDYIFERFRQKTKLKDIKEKERLYNIEKTRINGVFGCHVQKPVQDDIVELYDDNEYIKEILSQEAYNEKYEKYVNSRNSILPYQWGAWVTSYAMYNLFKLGLCCDDWIYSDTDSCYGIGWDEDKIKAYNESCIIKLSDNGYGGVYHNGKKYYLGVAELDGEYSEFKTLGAKKYCCRDKNTGNLEITIAGVPKSGVKCLHDDIKNFKHDFIFDGKTTKKLTHFYNSVDEIYTDEKGNIIGDSVDLCPCDYKLQETILEEVNWNDLNDDIEVQIVE